MDDFKVSAAAQLRYLQRRIQEVSSIEQNSKIDFELAEKIGHQLRGNAESFEFPDLAVMGKNLNVAAKLRREQSVRNHVSEILKVLQCHLDKNAALP